jgi:hypothetical protein
VNKLNILRLKAYRRGGVVDFLIGKLLVLSGIFIFIFFCHPRPPPQEDILRPVIIPGGNPMPDPNWGPEFNSLVVYTTEPRTLIRNPFHGARASAGRRGPTFLPDCVEFPHNAPRENALLIEHWGGEGVDVY